MLKLLTLVALGACLYIVQQTEAWEVVKNPPGYGSYDCPKGFDRHDLSYKTEKHFTFMQWGSRDEPQCALKGTKAKCKKPNGKKKFWMTYFYGYGEFNIKKFDRFSDMSSGSSSTSTSDKGGDSSSSSLVPQKFAVRAIYFYVRGVDRIVITLIGDISQRIDISEQVLDWRKKTFICIKFDTFPVYDSVSFEFFFARKRKAKFWGLFMISCCERLTDKIVTVGRK